MIEKYVEEEGRLLDNMENKIPEQVQEEPSPFAIPAEEKKQTVTLNQQPKKKMEGWKKGLIVLGVIVLCVVLLISGCSRMINNVTDGWSVDSTDASLIDYDYDYVGTLYVVGEIDEYGTGTYNHQYLLDSIDSMMMDEDNQGMILYIDTPGGTVFASDELYLKIREYQEETGRPVYSAMQSQATSGGYYISASCDKIIANRNTWTGSIGVTMGTFMDISGLLEDLGIETVTVTAGDNKAMGSSMEPMTEEQKEIFQSLVDDAYDQFVGIVAEGRGMDEKVVRQLADGRIYTANQAVNNGLVDQIGTFEEAVADMMETYDLSEDCSVEHFQPEAETDLYSLLGLLAEQKNLNGLTDADLIEELVALNGTFKVSYISTVKK